jgi:hypothetical protein
MARIAPDERIRVLRAQASIDSNCHMVGRVGRFRLESDEPPERSGTGPAPTVGFRNSAGCAEQQGRGKG